MGNIMFVVSGNVDFVVFVCIVEECCGIWVLFFVLCEVIICEM